MFAQKLLFTVILIVLNSSAKADGAIEINEFCVETGCFAGDAPGFPVNISEAGSYRLTSGLDLTEITSGAIRLGIDISASDVHLDLSGFSLNGSSVCTGGNPDCTVPPFDEIGIIIAPETANIVIEQGSINGMGRGIRIDGTRDLVVRDVRISDTAGPGLEATGTGLIDHVRIGNNGDRGIFLNSPSFHVRNSLFVNNGAFGVEGGYCSGNVFVTNSTLTGQTQEACLFQPETNFCDAAPC